MSEPKRRLVIFEFDEASLQTVEQLRAQGHDIRVVTIVHPTTGVRRDLLLPALPSPSSDTQHTRNAAALAWVQQ